MAIVETFNVAVRLDAFRTEVGGVVRSASPFLLSLQEAQGMALDDVVERIRPPLGWPRRPRLSPLAKVSPRGPHFLRLVSSGLMPYDWPATGPGPQTAVRFDGDEDGDGAAVRIEAHSVEVAASVGGVGFRTRFGLMEIALRGSLPVAVLTASVGRLVEEIVDHPALAGRGWRIVFAELVGGDGGPASFTVETGSTPYRLPWSRTEGARLPPSDGEGPAGAGTVMGTRASATTSTPTPTRPPGARP